MGHTPRDTDGICGIVSSFASRQDTTTDQIVDLFAKLRIQADIHSGSRPDEVMPPFSDPREAVAETAITCLCCGRSFQMLKRHLRAAHGLSEADYRLRFSLSSDYPLVAADYVRRKSEEARRTGLGKKRGHDL